MKLIKTQDAVGHVLCHDMTQIIKGEYKDARFRKGHIVTEGAQVVLGGNDSYIAMCHKCWKEKIKNQ